jgi:hypothetical protein
MTNNESLRVKLSSLLCVQAGLAFGVPEDGHSQWLDLVEKAVNEVTAERELANRQADSDLLRETLEAVCERDGISLESYVEPGEPARNYELALRLRIGRVFGLREVGDAQTASDSVPRPGSRTDHRDGAVLHSDDVGDPE